MAAVAAVALLAAGCTAPGRPGPAKPTSTTLRPGPPASGPPSTALVPVSDAGTISYALDSGVSGFNAAEAGEDTFATEQVMDRVWPSVFMTNPGFQAVPDLQLVQSATLVRTSPETIVYRINPKAVWSDGVPISADDFVYNWQAQSGDPAYKDLGGKAFQPASTVGYRDIKSVTGSDGGKTVTVVFARAFGDWESLFSTPGLVPAHIARTVGFDNGFVGFSPDAVISGGPYQVTQYVPGQQVTLSRNPRYWGPPAVTATIVMRVVPDQQVVAALGSGQVQVVYPTPDAGLVQELSQLPGLTQYSSPGLAVEHLDFNQRNPMLADLKVRQAIAMGLDRQALAAATVGQLDASIGMADSLLYAANQPQYQADARGYTTADPAGARALLAADGFSMGADGFWHKGAKVLELRITTTSTDPLRAQTQHLIQTQLAAIGIKLDPLTVDASTFFSQVLASGDFDIALFAWQLTPFASANQSIYSTGGPRNYDGYSDPQVDALFDKAVAQLDPSQATATFNQIDQLLWKDMASLPLFQLPTYLAFDENLGNVADNAGANGPPWDDDMWGIRAANP